jgi:hypothetical protein
MDGVGARRTSNGSESVKVKGGRGTSTNSLLVPQRPYTFILGLMFVIAMASLAACGGGGGSSPQPPVPTPTPAPTASPIPIATPFACAQPPPGFTYSPACSSFTNPGAAAQSVTIAEAGYSGAFAIDPNSTCLTNGSGSGRASISPLSGTTFSVTPVAVGTCAFTLSDTNGHTAQYTVQIASTTIVGQ